ncbi:MAG: hypothetical protein AAF602_13790 [Myxococcota bacterium]
MGVRMRWLAGVLFGLVPLTGNANEPDAPRFGVALNSSASGEVYPMLLVPSGILLLGKNQLEVGIGFHPFIRRDQRVWTGNFHYKYFPNGIDTVFSSYLLGRFSYVNNARDTFYPTTYHYLFLNGGYGVSLNNPNGLYVSTDVSIGAYTFDRRSDNPFAGFGEDRLFDEVGVNLTYQFSLGYRF